MRLMKMVKQDFVKWNAETNELICEGEWNLANISNLQHVLNNMTWPANGEIIVDGGAITKLDSAGAWLITRWLKEKVARHLSLKPKNFSEPQEKLLSLVEKEISSLTQVTSKPKPHWLARIGVFTCKELAHAKEFLDFTGRLGVEWLRLMAHPKRFRWSALVNVIDQTGLKALPIIGLLSFMIGIVIAYQMGNQLRTYGANIFIVDFLGLSILREFGPLLTSIMVAGRTGSSFTAQLGSMKINQEIDALNTLGVTPAELLILPRIIGLFIVLPLLAAWSDLFGLLGGMIMAKNMLGITPHDFWLRFQHAIPVRALIIGLGKAPVFALIIASVGCFEGMKVERSADSVGKQTTRSVVLSIFFIIVADAIFSVIFSKLKL